MYRKKAPRETRVCLACRVPFKVLVTSTQKYCSRKCYRSILHKETRECKNLKCGNVFEVLENSNKKYCSRICYWKDKLGKKQPEGANEKRKRTLNNRYQSRYEVRKCLLCGKDFKCNKRSPQRYCSRKCFGKSEKGKIPWNKLPKKLRICLTCGAPFECGEGSSQKFCSSKCYVGEARRKYGRGGRKKMMREIRICPVCKKEFEVRITSERVFCSVKCSSKNKEGKPRPEEVGRKVSLSQIGKPKKKGNQSTGQRKRFEDPVERNKIRLKRLGKHNSKESKNKNRIASLKNWQDPEFVKKARRKSSPNKPEKFLIKLFQQLLPTEYKYVGNGEFVLAGKNPDFININGQKKIIELYGDYWHKDDDPQDRINLFARYGYQTLVIWERELKDIEKLSKKVLIFNLGG